MTVLVRAASALRDGAWLTAERVRLIWRLLLVISLLVGLAWVALSKDGLDMTGNPLGPDFLNVYAAGRMVGEGRPAAVYDWPAHGAVESAVLPHEGYYGWHYPPMFLALAAPLARLTYTGALGLYLAVTFALYIVAAAVAVGDRLPPALRREALLLAAVMPAALVNLGHGQNGFLTAALLTASLALLDRRPVLAGVLIGLLAYKPQFGLLIPIALLADRQWRTIAAAAITVLLTAGASLLAFGVDAWVAFAGSLKLTRTIILEEGATGWEKIVSLFSAARAFGAPLTLAYAVQFAGTAAAAVVVALVWAGKANTQRKGAVLALALPLATPYVLDYDLTILLPAVLSLALVGLGEGFGRWRGCVVAGLYLTPLVSRQIGLVTPPAGDAGDDARRPRARRRRCPAALLAFEVTGEQRGGARLVFGEADAAGRRSRGH